MTERASQAYFIKLGRAGEWEAECLRDGIIRLGFLWKRHPAFVQKATGSRSGTSGKNCMGMLALQRAIRGHLLIL